MTTEQMDWGDGQRAAMPAPRGKVTPGARTVPSTKPRVYRGRGTGLWRLLFDDGAGLVRHPGFRSWREAMACRWAAYRAGDVMTDRPVDDGLTIPSRSSLEPHLLDDLPLRPPTQQRAEAVESGSDGAQNTSTDYPNGGAL